MSDRLRRAQSSRLTAEPGTLEFLRQHLEIAEQSDHPMDRALTKVLEKQTGETTAVRRLDPSTSLRAGRAHHRRFDPSTGLPSTSIGTDPSTELRTGRVGGDQVTPWAYLEGYRDALTTVALAFSLSLAIITGHQRNILEVQSRTVSEALPAGLVPIFPKASKTG